MLPLNYNKPFYTRDLGIPVDDLLLKKSGFFKECELVPFLDELEKTEQKSLREEENQYGPANRDWEIYDNSLLATAMIGFGSLFASFPLLSSDSSRVTKVIGGFLLFSGTAAWLGGLVGNTKIRLATGILDVPKRRLLRLSAKIEAINGRLSALEINEDNANEICQLKLASNYFNSAFTNWNGREITNKRLPIGTLSMRLTLKN